MNYPAAWELATQEWALPQSGNQDETTSGDLPPPAEPVRDTRPGNRARRPRTAGARASAARLPDNRGPPDRAGRAEGKSPRQYRGDPHAQAGRRRKPRGARTPKKPCSPATAAGARSSNVFHPYPRSDWQEIARDVKEHLTPEEYDSARASTPNAHFTSPMVIQALWQAMERFGLARRREHP